MSPEVVYTESDFAAAIKMACWTDYEATVGESPEHFEYEVLHLEDDGFSEAVVLFRGRDPGTFGTTWTGVAYFQYQKVLEGQPDGNEFPAIIQVIQYLEGGPPYIINV